MTTATIVDGIQMFNPIPRQGNRFLSVNLAKTDLYELISVIREMGFTPRMVQMQTKTGLQVHALLWEGAIADTPSNMDELVDELSDRINPDAIRYATGAWN